MQCKNNASPMFPALNYNVYQIKLAKCLNKSESYWQTFKTKIMWFLNYPNPSHCSLPPSKLQNWQKPEHLVNSLRPAPLFSASQVAFSRYNSLLSVACVLAAAERVSFCSPYLRPPWLQPCCEFQALLIPQILPRWFHVGQLKWPGLNWFPFSLTEELNPVLASSISFSSVQDFSRGTPCCQVRIKLRVCSEDFGFYRELPWRCKIQRFIILFMRAE